jgi:glycosyltransferase involved in cell wall biosynthesis
MVAHTPRRAAGLLPHLVFAGGARAEKGNAKLPEALKAVAGRARFTVHSGPVDSASDPLVQQAHRQLRAMAGASIKILDYALEPEAYSALLASADLLLLPYDAAAYGPRSSGILAEALALGVPAVVPSGCWMAEVAGTQRAVMIAQDDTLAAALTGALDRLPELCLAAEAGSAAWSARHNPHTLLSTLLERLAPA